MEPAPLCSAQADLLTCPLSSFCPPHPPTPLPVTSLLQSLCSLLGTLSGYPICGSCAVVFTSIFLQTFSFGLSNGRHGVFCFPPTSLSAHFFSILSVLQELACPQDSVQSHLMLLRNTTPWATPKVLKQAFMAWLILTTKGSDLYI